MKNLRRKRGNEEFLTEGTEVHRVHGGIFRMKNFSQRAQRYTEYTEEYKGIQIFLFLHSFSVPSVNPRALCVNLFFFSLFLRALREPPCPPCESLLSLPSSSVPSVNLRALRVNLFSSSSFFLRALCVNLFSSSSLFLCVLREPPCSPCEPLLFFFLLPPCPPCEPLLSNYGNKS